MPLLACPAVHGGTSEPGYPYAQLLAEDVNEDGILDSNRQSAALSLTGQTATDECFAGFDDMDLFLSGRDLRAFLEDLAAAGVI